MNQDDYRQSAYCLVISYNRPKFNAYATWSDNAVTFATNNTVGKSPYSIFINTDNTVYVANRENGRIQVWLNGSTNLTRTISVNLSLPYSIFVTSNDDIYTDTGTNSTSQVQKRSLNTNTSIVAMYSGQKCFGLFIDSLDVLYCSMSDLHQAVAKSLNTNSDVLTIVAGTGCAGSTSNMLNVPMGIFVNINRNLYVADCNNDRIQLFQPNLLNATTVAGNGATGTITLNCPAGIVLDADNYLFIADKDNNRIVGSGPNGFRCLVGCFSSGSASNQLLYPWSLSFDSIGNIFVTDQGNNRIQKFILVKNNFSKCCEYLNISKSVFLPLYSNLTCFDLIEEFLRNISVLKSSQLLTEEFQ